MSGPGGGHGPSDSQLAVLLRQAQWALDEAAHDLPAGRVSAQRRDELAGRLEALAVLLRGPVPEEQARAITQAPAGAGLRKRTLGVALLLALVIALVVVAVVIALVWGAS